MRRIPLLTQRLRSWLPKDYHEFVRSLYERPKGASSVSGIKISFGKKVTQVRVTRDKREITHAELILIAKEYEKPAREIKELLLKRKVKVL